MCSVSVNQERFQAYFVRSSVLLACSFQNFIQVKVKLYVITLERSLDMLSCTGFS